MKSNSEKESLTQKAIHIIQNVTKDPSYQPFLPFYHGTSTYHYKKIKQEGLCPRGKRPSSWGSGNLQSKEDLVYIAGCGETQIPSQSAWNAKESLSWLLFHDLRDNPEELHKALHQDYEKLFLRLDDITPYKDKLVGDEDNPFPSLVEWSLYNTDLKDKNQYPHTFCSDRMGMDKRIIDAFDIAWYDKGLEGVRQVANHIPKHLQSLYSNGTVAIKGQCIKPEALTPKNQSDFYADNGKCVKINSCSPEEEPIRLNVVKKLEIIRRGRDVNQDDIDAYNKALNEFREYVKKNKIDTL